MQVQELWIHPVKSCRGMSVAWIEVVETGFRYDRQWMIVDDKGVFVSQRKDPILATIRAVLSSGNLTFLIGRDVFLSVPMDGSTNDIPVQVHGETLVGADVGDDAAQQLSEVIGRSVRLVRKPQVHTRLSPSGAADVAFADAYPFLMTTTSSLRDLNTRLAIPLPMDRFRPNIVVRGDIEPFAEDSWEEFQIGTTVKFAGRTRCTRCAITTTDQRTGVRSSEPLRTLLTYRVFPGSKSPCFGLNADHLSRGFIRVGDKVNVTRIRTTV